MDKVKERGLNIDNMDKVKERGLNIDNMDKVKERGLNIDNMEIVKERGLNIDTMEKAELNKIKMMFECYYNHPFSHYYCADTDKHLIFIFLNTKRATC